MNKILLLIILFVFPIFAQAQLTASFTTSSPLCVNDTVFFTNTSTGTYALSHWEFGDGTDTWTNNPKHFFKSTGDFSVKLTIIDNSGTNDNTTNVLTINPVPSISLINDDIMQSLTVHSIETTLTYKWVFNADTTAETDSVIYYLESGLFTVVATNSFTCSASAAIKISLGDTNRTGTDDTLSVIVKNNILTPDIQDGANDILFVDELSSFINTCSVSIYNKWGQLVYLNNDYTNLGGFEGKDNRGTNLDAGTYYYIIRSQGRKTATGYIDLIR